MTEAREIRAESTQNKHTELRDNPEPKHQRKREDTPSSIIQQESTPKKNTGDEMRRYCPSSLAQEKQDVMSFYAWGYWWTIVQPALKLVMLWEKTVAAFILVFYVFCFIWSRQVCLKSWQLYQWDDHWNEALNSLQASGHVVKVQRGWRESCAHSNSAPLCTIHCSGDWCGFLRCHYSTSYFTAVTKALVQGHDSVP